MMSVIKKIFGAVIGFFKGIIGWIQYQEFKPNKDIVGIFVALLCAAALFYLPSYDPGFSMTADEFADVCEDYGHELVDITDDFRERYVDKVVTDTEDDYILKFYSCKRDTSAKFYAARECVEIRRDFGGHETDFTNAEFSLTTFKSLHYSTIVYRNGSDLLIIHCPASDKATLEALSKKCRIPTIK